MGEIVIPGDELTQLMSLLPRVRDLLGSADQAGSAAGGHSASSQPIPTHTPNAGAIGYSGAQEGTISDPILATAIQNFHTRWSDGNYQIGKEVQNMHDAAHNILDLFTQTDQELSDVLQGKTPAHGGGPSRERPSPVNPKGRPL